jgi:prepilin-type N-terminal cleavage/methylation domain-containing protein
MSTDSRGGFTLIELVVALLIVGMVVLLTHQLFTVVVQGAQTIVERRQALDREANARRWLEGAWLSLDVGEQAGGFEGHRDHVEFATWTLVPGGWFERERVRLDVTGHRFVARSGSRALVLSDSVEEVAFDYLLTPGETSQWVQEWMSPSSAPLAVRLRVLKSGCRGACADTLLFLIGPRG